MTRQRGFTMIEILVACAVIVILLGLLFLGGKAIINNQKKTSTKTTLANLQAMVTEREAAVGAPKIRNEIDKIFFDAGLIATNSSPPPPYTPVNGAAIGNLARDADNRTPQPDNHVGVTQDVLKLLAASEVNRKALQNLPSEQLLERGTLDKATVARYRDGTVVLDAWDNPILVMPASGVELNHEVGGVRVIRSKDGKPFFVSAGPDGFFSQTDAGQPAADDNIYSFEN